MKRFFLFLLTLFTVSTQGADFLPPAPEVFEKLRKQLEGQGDREVRTFKRLGDRTIEAEIMISLDAPMDEAPRVLGNFAQYSRWVLPGINVRSNGEPYRIQISEMQSDPKQPELFHMKFNVAVSIFKQAIERDFLSRMVKDGSVVTMYADANDLETSHVQECHLAMRVYPAGDYPKSRTWMFIRGTVKLKSWILYEALPEKILLKETSERLQTLASNYITELMLVRSNQSPKEKTAKPEAQANSRPKEPDLSPRSVTSP